MSLNSLTLTSFYFLGQIREGANLASHQKNLMKSSFKDNDPGLGVTKDPSKTFYFRDVLNCIFKRT